MLCRLHAVDRSVELHALQSPSRGQASAIRPSPFKNLDGVDKLRPVRQPVARQSSSGTETTGGPAKVSQELLLRRRDRFSRQADQVRDVVQAEQVHLRLAKGLSCRCPHDQRASRSDSRPLEIAESGVLDQVPGERLHRSGRDASAIGLAAWSGQPSERDQLAESQSDQSVRGGGLREDVQARASRGRR